MAELERFLVAVEGDQQEAARIAGSTAQKLEKKETNLLAVVESLKDYISDEDATIRGKTLSYLTAVLQHLPPKFLSRQQVDVLVEFFCDRIEDGGAVTGLDTLQQVDRFTKQMAEKTARALFQHSSRLRSRSQSQRFQTLQLLNGLMSNHRAALRDMNDESITGILDIVSGERDPRNLMVVFSILKVIMVEWNISNYVQDLFESAYNYFPITFRPPPNDPYGITAQDLKDRVQACLSSNDAFAPHAFPLLIDKLDSTSFNVKRDTLNAIRACIDSYLPTTLARYSIPLWDALKFEILNAQEEVLATESLNLLRALAMRLSEIPVPSGKQSQLAHYLRPITKECNEQLREPQQKQAKPAREILSSLSSASPAAFALVIQDVMPPLLTIYQDADEIAKQRELLECFCSLFESAVAVYGSWVDRTGTQAPDNPLSLFQERLIEVFTQALTGEEVSIQTSALRGYLQLCILKNFLRDNEIESFIRYLDGFSLTESTSAELRNQTVAALAEISKHKPQLIMDITFPTLLARLPDSDADGNINYVRVLESLAQISVERDVFETLVRRLLSKLDTLLGPDSTSTPSYATAILLTLFYAMDRRNLHKDPQLNLYYDKIVRNLCRRAARAANGDKSAGAALVDPTALETLGRLCNLVLLHLSRPEQEEAGRQVYGLFATEDGFLPVPSAENPTEVQRRTLILSTSLLAATPKDFADFSGPDRTLSALLDEIVQLAISEGNPVTQLALVRHAALLVNKFWPAKELSKASDLLTSLMRSATEGSKLPPNQIRTILWLLKALILRLAPTTSEILTSLLDLLGTSDAETSLKLARGFALILAPDDILSSKNGANVRLLAQQKVFTTAVPLIATRVREFNTTASSTADTSSAPPIHVKHAYLTALSGILSTVPSKLVAPELPTLFPLLLQTLDLTGPDSQPIKSRTLDLLAVIIRENGVRTINMLGYVDDLVNRLLKTASTAAGSKDRASSNKSNSPSNRAKALQCLHLLAKHPTAPDVELTASEKAQASPLLRLKPSVLRSLKLILDDPKRDVRKAAVDARAAWLRSVEDGKSDDD